MFRRSKNPLQGVIDQCVIITSAGYTWRGVLTGSDGAWILLEQTEYIDERGIASPADGQLLLRADRVDYIQIVPHRISEVG